MREYTVNLSRIEYCVLLEVEEIKAKRSGDLEWRPVGQSENMFESCFEKTGRKKFRYIFHLMSDDALIFHGEPGRKLYADLMTPVEGKGFSVIEVTDEDR
jgi:hypothetical protein